MNEKKYSCNVIRDLLPLYQDDVCSEDSKRIVQEHLKECDTCRRLKEELENSEVDDMLKIEKENVLERHVKAEKGQFMTKIIGLDLILNILLSLGTLRVSWREILRFGTTPAEAIISVAIIIVPLVVFVICELIYFILRYRKKFPYITEKYAHVSIGVKVVILVVGLFIVAVFGVQDLAVMLSSV